MTIKEIKQRKQELGYSNAQLAALSGVPLGTVMKVLSGATKSPRRETLLALEKALSPYRYPTSDNVSILRETPFVYGTSPKREPLPAEFSASKETDSAPVKSGRQTACRLYTVDDYYALPDDIRTELIDGVFYNMSSPSVTHQLIIGEMHVQFKECERKHKGRCRVILSPCDVQLDKDAYTMLQPDILVVCDMEKIKGRNCYGAPDLTVEVLSPSNSSHDCILKLRKYKSAGVREYWIADPANRHVLVYRFDEPDNTHIDIYSFEDTIPVGISNGECSIDFKTISDYLQFQDE